jgi:hypothetical protein
LNEQLAAELAAAVLLISGIVLFIAPSGRIANTTQWALLWLDKGAWVNLHNVWYRGTVEYRWFEATLHAGKIRSYVQLCLAISAKALNARSAASSKRTFSAESARYDFRVFLLHLGMIGEEFKTARQHLIEKMPGSSAFKNGRPKPQAPTTLIVNNTEPDALQAAQA